jgi:hypothetical protein
MPKERAIELVGKMRRDNEMPYQYAKQCAVIAVNYIINECDMFDRIDGYVQHKIDYWYEVKNEIEKL